MQVYHENKQVMQKKNAKYSLKKKKEHHII